MTRAKPLPNPNAKRNHVVARVNNDELREILKRALYYCKGNLSEYARLALLNYGKKK